jgi:regulatory protein
MTDCYTAALRILEYRFNSEAELRRKLVRKGFEADVIEATLARLRDEKWLDDERFAAAFVRARQRKKVGPHRIRRELGAAGVDRDTIARAVAENAGGETAALAALCAKRARVLIRRHGEEFLRTDEGRNKLAGWLLNQGYDAALVLSAIKEFLVADHQSDS